MSTVESRVRVGATFMDESVVGWAKKINLRHFNMALCGGCVIGQTLGEYYEGCKKLGIEWAQASAMGFHSELALGEEEANALSPEEDDANTAAILAELRLLKAAWLAEIALRLEEARVEAQPEATYASPL